MLFYNLFLPPSLPNKEFQYFSLHDNSYFQRLFYYEIGDSSGDLVSSYKLGKLYEKVGDYAKSIEFYKKAEDRIDKTAAPMYEALGDLYANGKGVEKSTKEAREYYEKAIKSGSQEAKNKLVKLK